MTERTRTLGQVVGVESHHRQADEDAVKALRKKVQSGELTTGSSKIYLPDDPDAPGVIREPDLHKPVAVKVEEALLEAAAHAIRALDTIATKDRTNQAAKADIVVNGDILVHDVPVSHLLWLDKHFLQGWKTSLDALPVLDPTRNWTPDQGKGVHKSDPVENVRNLKEPAALVGIQPTKEHPGQWQSYQKETRVGKYVTTTESGAIPENRKKRLLDHHAALTAAVKDAIARANHTAAIEVTEGEALFRYLLG